MNLLRALRLESPPAAYPVVSFAGAGGKTTALFQLARQFKAKFDARYANSENPISVIVTATAHLGIWQIPLADRHIIAQDAGDCENFPDEGITLVTGEIEGNRTKPVNERILYWLYEYSKKSNSPLLIEADGSRQKPLKAPAAHEPPIPPFTDIVVQVAGLSALGKPLDENRVHRAEIFSQTSGLALGETIAPQAVTKALIHPKGGLKNIPTTAKRIALLNQADTPELRSIGGGMAKPLLQRFDSVVIGSLLQPENFQTFEPVAGIILAAGESTRFGSPKQLLDWKGKPFVRQIAETALRAGLEPVLVVTGFRHPDVESALRDLPVTIVHNFGYTQGQSASIKAGVEALPSKTGATIFLLADQPQIPVEVVRALTEAHARDLPTILAPLVREERRANPVLFDRVAFPHLLQLTGDTGGRAIFDKFRVSYLPWHDDTLLFDVDKPEDYERLKNLG